MNQPAGVARLDPEPDMSIDRSLKTEGSLTTKRSVMKRHERLEALKEEKRHEGGEKGALGLPKTKVREG